MKRGDNKKLVHRFLSVPSQQSKGSEEITGEYERRIQEHSYEESDYSSNYPHSRLLIDLQNLDIEPIQNTTGDKFIIEEIDQHDKTNSSNSTFKTSSIQFLESSVWADVFYAKKSIMSLLQQRNQVCQMYNLNSKSLKHINSSQPTKRIYTDQQIAQYAKQLFEESPSYDQLDHICFTVIPQINSLAEKYFVFMGCDDKFVPQCKSCSISAYLILNVETNQKSQMTQSSFGDKFKKSALIKGKILCSNLKCKKKLLGEFVISQEEKKLKFGEFSRQNTLSSTGQEKVQKIRFEMDSSEKKVQPELSQRQKMLVKKATMKINV